MSNLFISLRYMLGLAAVPSLIQFVGFLFMPESPRWLMGKDRHSEAVSVLKKIRNCNDVTVEVEQIRANVDEDRATGCFPSLTLSTSVHNSLYLADGDGATIRRAFTSRPVRRALFVGCMMQVFQQISGINTVMYVSNALLDSH